MFNINDYKSLSQNQKYDTMLLALEGIIDEKSGNNITNLCNASSVINAFLDDVNWCGFYIANNNNLELGPFQGNPACIKIPFSKGVCGACVTKKEVIVVYDVHEFEGHIACDALTNSEIVLPILDNNNEVVAVLDIDSEKIGRFTDLEKEYLMKAVKLLESNIDWEKIRSYYI